MKDTVMVETFNGKAYVSITEALRILTYKDQKIDRFEKQLEKAEKELRFYADWNMSWNYDYAGNYHRILSSDTETWEGVDNSYGGKRAREYFNNKEKK